MSSTRIVSITVATVMVVAVVFVALSGDQQDPSATIAATDLEAIPTTKLALASFPWDKTLSCKAGMESWKSPNIYVSPNGFDACVDTDENTCSKAYVPEKCNGDKQDYFEKLCPLTCGVCNAPPASSYALGSRENPYKTLAGAVAIRASHRVEKTGDCVTINLMEGTYRNSDFGTEGGGSEYILNLDGVSDVIIKNDDVESGATKAAAVTLRFDGPGGLRGGASEPVTNFEIYGLEIAGPNQQVTYADAMAARIPNDKNMYKGQGISIWSGHHIWIHDMLVHDTPAAGIRVNNADYVVLEDSEVYNTCWWSSTAESAIVLAESKAIDTLTKTKMIMRNNKVYRNMNKIPYFNPNYAWDYFPIGKPTCTVAATKAKCKILDACCNGEDQSCCSPPEGPETSQVADCPWECRYGKASQDFVIDGQGVYVTRNSDTYLYGAMELSNNVAYGNGINGLVFHRTFNGNVQGNIIFDNGALPKDGYTPSDVACDKLTDSACWKIPLISSLNSGKQKCGRQPYSGLTINNAKNVQLWDNRVKAKYDDDMAYKFELDQGNEDFTLGDGGNNQDCKGKVDEELAGVVNEFTKDSSNYATYCTDEVFDAFK